MRKAEVNIGKESSNYRRCMKEVQHKNEFVPEEENQKIYYLILTIFEITKVYLEMETHDTFQKRKGDKITLLQNISKSLILLVRKSIDLAWSRPRCNIKNIGV